jgi:hypothetical protein
MMYMAKEVEDTEAAQQAVIQRHPTKRNESLQHNSTND